MSALFFSQLLNGLQLGVLLFLLSAGLTLVFGVMNFINLTHGSMYMVGAYVGAMAYNLTGQFVLGLVAAIVASGLLALAVDRLVAIHLYRRDHLYQVLATFGLILFFNESARMIWGASPYYTPTPESLSVPVEFGGFAYSAYRLVSLALGLAVAVGCYLLINRTRIGMLIRAGASNPRIVSALGINIRLLNSFLFALGGALAGFAGMVSAPLLSVQPGMGEPVLILAMVVVVIGGIGSVRGAFYAALIVGVIDTLGRSLLPILLQEIFGRAAAKGAGPAVASMLIYLFMAAVLAVRPQGLFPEKNR